jgi:hypothetical protein
MAIILGFVIIFFGSGLMYLGKSPAAQGRAWLVLSGGAAMVIVGVVFRRLRRSQSR